MALACSLIAHGMNRNPIGRLRLVGVVEGISFLLLLGIAMPLKYLAEMPMAVSVVGMAHGVLFIAYALCLLSAMMAAEWPLSRGVRLMLAALIPFGPWLVDKRLATDELELDQRLSSKP